MDELNKSQLILLALLVSFVTSIATGIVTVILMEQAPADFVRTIDRVVEKTIETIIPGETKVVEKIKEVQVGSTDSEKMVRVVSANKSALVAVTLGDVTRTGILVSKQGHVLSTGLILGTGDKVDVLWLDESGAELIDVSMTAESLGVYGKTDLALLKIIGPNEDEKNLFEKIFGTNDSRTFPFLTLKQPKVVLGGFVIAMSLNTGVHSVETGIVNSYKTSTASSTSSISVDIETVGKVGSPVFSLGGDMLGILGLETVIGQNEIIGAVKLAEISGDASSD